MSLNPRILIVVEGGVVQDVISDGAVDVFLKDEDNIEAGDTFDPDDKFPVTEYDRETFTQELADAAAQSTEQQLKIAEQKARSQ